MGAHQTMKQRRTRLFGKSRPLVRPFDPQTDMWVMWAAYDLGSFPALPKELTFKEFSALVMAQVQSRSRCLVIEDDNKYFKAGRGPACFVAVDNFGWRIEPHVDFFMWASKRMILRCVVAFLQMVRYSTEVGVCLVRSLHKTANLFEHAGRYCMLAECGKIPWGDPRGYEFLFSIKGARNAGTHGAGLADGRRVQRDGAGGGQAVAGAERRSELPGDAVSGFRRRASDDEERAGGGFDSGREIRPVVAGQTEGEFGTATAGAGSLA